MAFRSSSYSPLAGERISELNLEDNPITDLSALQGMPLKILRLSKTSVADLKPLRDMPLEVLILSKSKVSDLITLKRMPALEKLHCDDTPIEDLSPLLTMPKLRGVLIPRTAKNIAVLRPLKNLTYLGWEGDYSGPSDSGHPLLKPDQFWTRYDALNATGK